MPLKVKMAKEFNIDATWPIVFCLYDLLSTQRLCFSLYLYNVKDSIFVHHTIFLVAEKKIVPDVHAIVIRL